MKYIILIFLLFFSLNSYSQYRKDIMYNLNLANKYDSLYWCSKKCYPDSTRYYNGLRTFYLNEVEYYWTLEYGLDDMKRVTNRQLTEPFILPKCKCN